MCVAGSLLGAPQLAGRLRCSPDGKARAGGWHAALAPSTSPALPPPPPRDLQAGLDEVMAQLRRWGGFVDGDPLATENRLIVLTGVGGVACACAHVQAREAAQGWEVASRPLRQPSGLPACTPSAAPPACPPACLPIRLPPPLLFPPAPPLPTSTLTCPALAAPRAADAEANCGDVSETGLLARLKAAAADRLYATIVGERPQGAQQGAAGRSRGRSRAQQGAAGRRRAQGPGAGPAGGCHAACRVGPCLSPPHPTHHTSLRQPPLHMTQSVPHPTPSPTHTTPPNPTHTCRRSPQAWAWTSRRSWWRASCGCEAPPTSQSTPRVSGTSLPGLAAEPDQRAFVCAVRQCTACMHAAQEPAERQGGSRGLWLLLAWHRRARGALPGWPHVWVKPARLERAARAGRLPLLLLLLTLPAPLPPVRVCLSFAAPQASSSGGWARSSISWWRRWCSTWSSGWTPPAWHQLIRAQAAAAASPARLRPASRRLAQGRGPPEPAQAGGR